MNNFFIVNYRSKKSRARSGEIKTSHGTIKTPAFVPVGTKGTIKSLFPTLIEEIGIQVAFVNTYHLVTHPGVEIIANTGGIHKFSKLNVPLMSDSGGFQVFSLARKSRNNAEFDAEIRGSLAMPDDVKQPPLVKINEDGVKFRSTFDGTLIEFTPEKSMEYQRKIGADINMAFDECTYYPAAHEYAKDAMERTHRWLLRCMFRSLKHSNLNNCLELGACDLEFNQYLYGVIQGGAFEDLRKKSAQFVVNQGTDGVAIGGVSVGESKKEMRNQVKWVADYLPADRPVHLLGVGQVDDIIDLVKYGIDTFDCVEPTRIARMGSLYQSVGAGFSERIDILRGVYRYNLEKVDENCDCYVCQNFTKAYLHHLFKTRELLGYTLATYHNLWAMERLMESIREAIGNDKL